MVVGKFRYWVSLAKSEGMSRCSGFEWQRKLLLSGGTLLGHSLCSSQLHSPRLPSHFNSSLGLRAPNSYSTRPSRPLVLCLSYAWRRMPAKQKAAGVLSCSHLPYGTSTPTLNYKLRLCPPYLNFAFISPSQDWKNSSSQSWLWTHRNLEFSGFPHLEQAAILESCFQDFRDEI